MGNSHTTTVADAGRPAGRAAPSTAAAATVSGRRSDADGGGAGAGVVGWQGKSKNGLPREEALRAVPGRIFSNEGRSAVASIYTQQGRKGINQDAMILWEDFGGEGGSILCGVFDGHGPHGHLVARKVRDALPLKLLSFLPKPGGDRRPGLGCFGSRQGLIADDPTASGVKSLSAWKEVFLRSYKATDKKLRSHPTVDCFCSGSTAVTLLKLGSNLFVGNIGDSRAVLGSKDDSSGSLVAVQLTVDLKPDLPREAERIKKCRGRVFALQDEPEVPRVWLPFDDAPGLAMARAFGDFCLKDYGVISVPEFFHWTLTDNDHFVVLASDGVWDVLSNQEVVDIISSSPARSSAAKLLVEAAAREWKLKYPTSKMDDCTVVCLYLDGKMATEPVLLEHSSSINSCGLEDSNNEPIEVQICEPTLDRNFTVRSSVGNRLLAAVGENGNHAATDQDWSSLEGVTRVNSIVQLPRFSDENANS